MGDLTSVFFEPAVSGSLRFSDELDVATDLRCSLPTCGPALTARLGDLNDEGVDFVTFESPLPRTPISSVPAFGMGVPGPEKALSPATLPFEV